ncbi:hypothetical protein [Paenibacillus sp. Mc5Re-14]|uniref:hypothetical protein n=1 Tax=Paenibacillus sp. Mc5Re-14 TaxID=1030529 RepID=UPI000B2F6D90|nr:hypothetical protein [Paenibacillus sp. Mc5Re-14]
MNEDILIKMYVEASDEGHVITGLTVSRSGSIIETIINDDKHKDIRHLNQYAGAVIMVFYNREFHESGVFEKAGFNKNFVTSVYYK